MYVDFIIEVVCALLKYRQPKIVMCSSIFHIVELKNKKWWYWLEASENLMLFVFVRWRKELGNVLDVLFYLLYFIIFTIFAYEC